MEKTQILKDYSHEQQVFHTSDALIEFLSRENAYWKQNADDIPKEDPHLFFRAPEVIAPLLNTVKTWACDFESYTDSNWQHLRQKVRELENRWLSSSGEHTEQFIEIQKKFGKKTASAFIETITKRDISNVQSAESFIGANAGSEALLRIAKLAPQSDSELKSLQRFRETVSGDYGRVFNETKKENTELVRYIKATKKEWETLKENTIKENSNALLEVQKTHETIQSEATKKIEALEQTYENKLRLQKPAEYWKKAASRYRLEGHLFATLLLVVSLVTAFFISKFLLVWLYQEQVEFSINTLHGAVMFGTFLAVVGFLLRMLSRLTFSSYHLMRDAEEREQLTYVFLSLSSKGGISSQERQLILQALFRRTETGLLKQESGPSMPLSELTQSRQA